jgi:serine/threonine protein phosphatase PrpC
VFSIWQEVRYIERAHGAQEGPLYWTLSRFDFLTTFGGASHLGSKKEQNEDVWAADHALGLFVVADGIGRRAGGGIAARLAVDTTMSLLTNPGWAQAFDGFLKNPTLPARADVFRALTGAVQRAHDTVKGAPTQGLGVRGMGCTLEVVLLLRSHAFIAHVGDSRTYLSRPTTTIQVTTDHTLHGSLVSAGVKTPNMQHEGPNALTNSVGGSEAVKVDRMFVELSSSDRLIMLSDGTYEAIGDEATIGALGRRGHPQESAVGLVNDALAKGANDNSTAVVVEVGKASVARDDREATLSTRDLAYLEHCPLLRGLSRELVQKARAAAVEVSFDADQRIPRFDASDRVAYVIMQGTAVTPQGWTMNPSAILYPESLAGGGRSQQPCRALEPVRALRIRHDDFREVCQFDPRLASEVYARLARHLAEMLS